MCRTNTDRHGKRSKETVPLIGTQFLMLCDVLMHRAVFFSKAAYEKHMHLDDRSTFLETSREDHTAEGARKELEECWCNHVTYRSSKGMKMAFGMRVDHTPTIHPDGTPVVSARDRMAILLGEDGQAADAAGGGGAAAAAAAAGDGAGGGAPPRPPPPSAAAGAAAVAAAAAGDGAGGGAPPRPAAAAAAAAGGGAGALAPASAAHPPPPLPAT